MVSVLPRASPVSASSTARITLQDLPGAASVGEVPTLNPQPSTLHPQPSTSTRNPRPETLNPKPETQNLKPETQNPKPETRNPKPETRNPNQVAVQMVWTDGRIRDLPVLAVSNVITNP